MLHAPNEALNPVARNRLHGEGVLPKLALEHAGQAALMGQIWVGMNVRLRLNNSMPLDMLYTMPCTHRLQSSRRSVSLQGRLSIVPRSTSVMLSPSTMRSTPPCER